MFVGLGAMLVIVAVMSFFAIKGDRDRVDQANAKLREQQAETLNVGDTVVVEPLELVLKNAVLDTENGDLAVLTLELGINNEGEQPISLEPTDFVVYDGENKAVKPNKSAEEGSAPESSWKLDYQVNSNEPFMLHIASDELNEGMGAVFRLNLEQ